MSGSAVQKFTDRARVTESEAVGLGGGRRGGLVGNKKQQLNNYRLRTGEKEASAKNRERALMYERCQLFITSYKSRSIGGRSNCSEFGMCFVFTGFVEDSIKMVHRRNLDSDKNYRGSSKRL